jgi:CRISPR-associated endonuclease/helicase Cas3
MADDGEEPFRQFFHAATGGSIPYRWQVRAAVHGLPEVLPIPTGLGKTEGSVLAWAWRCFAQDDAREPLHLVYCLPMRCLVRQTVERLRFCFAALRTWNAAIDVHVFQLVGGEAEEEWVGRPDRSWVLVGTQDMLLSRALNRGYGMSRFDWPVHFGLLNQDCRWIVDEVQLMGPGLWTTAQLDWMRRFRFPGLKPCRTTWMSATLGTQFLATLDRRKDGCDTTEPFDPGIESDTNATLVLRRAARRRIEWHLPAAGKKAEPTARQIAAAARASHLPGMLTLIVCNTVKTAQEIFQSLETGGAPKILLTSRFRAGDRAGHEATLQAFEARRSASKSGRLEDGEPGLICVSTQVVEAGLDISAHRLWTEHAPWPSLIQRLGRLNRDGRANADAHAVVWRLAPEDRRKHEGEDWIGPYRKSALDLASTLLEAFIPLSVQMASAEALAKLREQKRAELDQALAIPPEPCPRALDVHGLFSTEPDAHGGFTDVSRFVRSADPDADLTVFWREWQDDARLTSCDLDGPPFEPREGCSVAVRRVQELLKAVRARAWLWNDRDGAWEALAWQDLKPGMTVMLRGNVGGYDRTLGWTGRATDRLSGLPPPGPGRAFGDDRLAETEYWSSLVSHLADARGEAERICDALALQGPLKTAVVETAGLHDLGKAHPDWRGAVPTGGPLDDKPVAKFPAVLRVEVSCEDAPAARAAVERELATVSPPAGASALSDEPTKDDNLVRLRWALSCKLGRDGLGCIRALPGVRWARHRAFPSRRSGQGPAPRGRLRARHVAGIPGLEGAAVPRARRLSRCRPPREGAHGAARDPSGRRRCVRREARASPFLIGWQSLYQIEQPLQRFGLLA